MILVHSSCMENEPPIIDDSGVIIDVEPKWVRSLHRNGFVSNSSLRENLVYQGNPIVATTEGEGNLFINLIDINTGEDIWKWNDIFEGYSEYIDISDSYMSNNFLRYHQGGRNFTINLDNGTTHKKEKLDRSFDKEIVGLENLFFLRGDPIDTLEQYETLVGYFGDLQTGEIEQFLVPHIDLSYITPDNRITAFSNFAPFVSNSDTFLVAVHSNPMPNWYIKSLLGLYNFSKKEWVYENIDLVTPTQSSGLSHYPIIFEGKVYMNFGNVIVCHDLYTGQKVWEKSFPLDFLFSGFIVEDGIVVANCENSILYGLDAQTGSEVWQGEGAGTSSYLADRCLNGIVYFSGGSTGNIHAVDIETGKSVWRLEPNLIEAGAERFKPDIYVIEGKNGAKGKVVVCTFKNAYCLEAYQ